MCREQNDAFAIPQSKKSVGQLPPSHATVMYITTLCMWNTSQLCIHLSTTPQRWVNGAMNYFLPSGESSAYLTVAKLS